MITLLAVPAFALLAAGMTPAAGLGAGLGVGLDQAAPACGARAGAPALPQADATALFYRYAAERAGGVQHLTVRVFLDERLWLTEEIAALPDEKADPIVELLSRDPRSLSELRRLDADKAHSVRFELVHPDGTTRSLPFAELASRSRALTAAPFLPQRSAAVLRFASGASPGGTRIPCDDCWTNYDNCISNCGTPACESRCERILNRCLANCTENCPTSQEVTESQVVGSQYLGSDCLQVPFESGGSYHDVWQLTIKYTRKRITYNCDGSQTVEILDVWYSTTICVSYTGYFSCPNPTYWPGCLV